MRLFVLSGFCVAVMEIHVLYLIDTDRNTYICLMVFKYRRFRRWRRSAFYPGISFDVKFP